MIDPPEAAPWLPPEALGTQAARAKLTGRRLLVIGAGTQPSDEPNPPPGNGRAVALSCAREGAAVVCVSTASLRPGTNLPAYDASKAGLGGLCRHVAMEGARVRIRANIVVPGLIDTPLGRNAGKRRPSRAKTAVPLGRRGTAWEVAQATVFLLSDEASYITGQSLVVDGGLSALR